MISELDLLPLFVLKNKKSLILSAKQKLRVYLILAHKQILSKSIKEKLAPKLKVTTQRYI